MKISYIRIKKKSKLNYKILRKHKTIITLVVIADVAVLVVVVVIVVVVNFYCSSTSNQHEVLRARAPLSSLPL